MDKFIPINKKSKKARKEYYVKKRNTWGEFNPMTRTMPNGKGYNRKKMKQEDRRNGDYLMEIWTVPFCILRLLSYPEMRNKTD